MRVVFMLAGLAILQFLDAREIYVDYQHGSVKGDGTREMPMTAFAQAKKVANFGDVIRILPSPDPIRDVLVARNLLGEQGKPIVIDGMNNIFTGAMPLNAAD